MLKSIDHIGIAVRDLDESLETFRKLLQFDDVHRQTVADQKVEIASFAIGGVKIELTSPTSEDSPIAKFIAKRGEGIHHIAFASDGIEADLERIKDDDIRLIDEVPRQGAHDMLIAFLHPKSLNGVLAEVCQRK